MAHEDTATPFHIGRGQSQQVSPGILQQLELLETTAQQISDTWRPDDAAFQAEFSRQITMNLSSAYFIFFYADAEHPDWSPLYNPVYAAQPNPDDIYLYSPIRGDLTYRVNGTRGTTRLLTFNTKKGISGTVDDVSKSGTHNIDYDDRDLQIGPNGELEVLFSARRPEGWTGNWCRLDPEADTLVVRCRMVDWEKERDPELSIECLDPVAPKRRLLPAEIYERIRKMAKFTDTRTRIFLGMQNDLRARVGINVFEPTRIAAGLPRQIYWPAVFQFNPDEALIIETELPKKRPYWNVQLNDPLFNTVEYVYRISSLNESTAWIGADGKFRAVIALEDPAVSNWLDPAGYTEGTIYGRWYDCDSAPVPTLKRVPFSNLHDYLPKDTPHVTSEQRAAELRARVRACQRRRRW
jgi:hypothetical protein